MASIVFLRDLAPVMTVNDKVVGTVTQIDLDLSMGTLTIEKVHVAPAHRNKLLGPTTNNPGVPDHPYIKIDE